MQKTYITFMPSAPPDSKLRAGFCNRSEKIFSLVFDGKYTILNSEEKGKNYAKHFY